MKPGRSLKNFLIYPKFQLVLIGVNCVFLIGSFLFVYFGVYKGFDSLKQAGVNAKVSSSHPFYKYLEYQESYILQYVIIALVVSLILTILFSMILSYKVVGPIKRLGLDLEKFINGENIEFSSRKGDYFREIPELINKLVRKERIDE
tara:strand:+ start:4478 stop:4918 length:441 start_codon:yes stop_codon:yes gene_type:complete